MSFSRDQILEIQQKLASYGLKDTDFELLPVTDVTGNETLAVVANGANKRLPLSTIKEFFTISGGVVSIVNIGNTAYLPSQGVITLPEYPSKLADLSEDATHKHVAQSEKNKWNNKQNAIGDLDTIRHNAEEGANAYQKPVDGIPYEDLTQEVKTSLEHADSALQELPSFKTINGQEIIGEGDIEVGGDSSNKIDKVEGATKNNIPVLTEDGSIADGGYKLSDYYRTSEIDRKLRVINNAITELQDENVTLTEAAYQQLVDSGRVVPTTYYFIYEEES